jgi:FkbM family methyltransferase
LNDQSTLCQTTGHAWTPTGLYVKGRIRVPCMRPGCPVGMQQTAYGWVLEPDGFSSIINGIPLDIEDDPDGGVAKVVMREVRENYALGDLGLKPGDIVLDIGAHVGIVSCFLAKRYPGIIVHAFEPVPANFARLQRNLAANGVTNVEAHCCAVTGDGRRLTLVGNSRSNSGGITAVIEAEPSHQRYEVASMTLADIFDCWVPGRCALLKIDCEGSEYEVLESGVHLLDRVDRLVGEFHWNNIIPIERLEGLLALCAGHVPRSQTTINACKIADSSPVAVPA